VPVAENSFLALRRFNAAAGSRFPAPPANYLSFGRVCLTRPMPAHGSFLSRDRRCITLPTVYWLALLRLPSSSQSIGTDIGAPGRARVENGATAVASRELRR